jgi:hypothetical protein
MDQQELKKIVRYEPETGNLFWLSRAPGRRKDLSMGTESEGYMRLCINRVRYPAHRLAWLYMTGEFPGDDEIDHRDGNGLNNKWGNLRRGTTAQNQQNQRRARSDNALGVLGVTFDSRRKKYRATIMKNGKQVHLGMHLTQEEASAAYLSAKRKLHEFCEI